MIKWLIPAMFFLPVQAYAHIMMGVEVFSFQAGFSHPVLGLDHLLAMVSVGIVSAQISGRAIWTVPTTFVLVMGFGGFLGLHQIGIILMEYGAMELGIAFSVIALGITIAFGSRMNTIAAMIFVGIFAIFHGYAHGAEIPDLATSWAYVAGFMTGTATLHIIGVLIGHFAGKIKHGTVLLSYSGAVIAGMGLHLLLGMFGF